MTPDDIIAKLFNGKGTGPQRVEKAKGLASRSKVDWALVVAAMTDDQRKSLD